MSGFKTTSIFGSLINMSICLSVLKRQDLTPSYMAALGDDLDLGFADSIAPKLIYDGYALIQFPIAQDKTKFTKGHN